MSEEGRKQQAKLKELAHISEKLGCTLPQLAIGKDLCLEEKNSALIPYYESETPLFPDL